VSDMFHRQFCGHINLKAPINRDPCTINWFDDKQIGTTIFYLVYFTL